MRFCGAVARQNRNCKCAVSNFKTMPQNHTALHVRFLLVVVSNAVFYFPLVGLVEFGSSLFGHILSAFPVSIFFPAHLFLLITSSAHSFHLKTHFVI